MFQLNFSRIALTLTLTSLCLAASADVKVVANVTVTGGREAGTKKITTSYKGKFIRTETDKTISIYDTASQTITTINKAGKTYNVLSLKDTFTSMPSMMAKLQVKANANIELRPDQGTIAGLAAKKYSGKATIKITSEGLPEENFPTTQIEIEQWMTEAVPTTTSMGGALMPMKNFIGPLQHYKGMGPVIDEFSKMKGVPLSSKVTLTVLSNPNSKTRSQGPITTTTQVLSVSSATLDASLFRVPEGYTRAAIRTPKPPNRRAP
jgi:hypothetical protein